MLNYADRRLWLKQAAIAMAGLGLSSFDLPQANKFEAGAIVLSNNENAYGPSPLARKAMLENYLQSNRYPDDAIVSLQKALAEHWKLSPENILLGAGSSEIIGLACQYAATTKGHIICADPSYEEWATQATAFGLSVKKNPFPQKGELAAENLYGPLTADTRMIYLCNPNNPTGAAIDTKSVAAFAQAAAATSIVFIDEAYGEYAKMETLAPLAVTNPNIIVAKTFSKIYGLAGARIGYAIGHPDTILTLSNYQPWPSANLSYVSVAAAMAALKDTAFVTDCYNKNIAAKEYCYKVLQQLNVHCIPSSANFILFNIEKIKDKFIQGMQQRNILVKYRDAWGGKWCRVTMGTMKELHLFATALKEIAA